MRDDVVLREKLRLPEVTGLARARLEQPLREGGPTMLDLVVAPAGSGKTTLLARVAVATTTPVGWYRITADDTTESRLVAHLAEALREVCDVSRTASMDALLADLDRWSGAEALLILDDLHEVADTGAECALERFVTLRPRRLRLIFGSRRVPQINIPRLRVSGALREIGNDDLRFRSWEVEELFAAVYHQPLRPEAAAALTRQTGGWAAGLQLFHLCTTGRTVAECHQAVADLGGRSKLVRSYLTRNVLAELPEDRRHFLLRTCTLDRLCGAACDALLNRAGSHRILEELEGAQLFTSIEDDGVHFRYHEILQTHLELALVEEYGQTQAKAWYTRSGVVLESLGERRSAARAYAKAGEWAAVSRLIEQAGGVRADAETVDDHQLLPAATWRQDPWLALANARRLARDGALHAAADAYRFAQSLYAEPRFQQICTSEKQGVMMWLPAADALGDADKPGSRHWSATLREALRVAPDFAARTAAGEDVRNRLALGLAAVVAGEVRWARDALESIRGDGSTDVTAMIMANLAWTALDLLGDDPLDLGYQLSDIAIRADAEGLPWLARLAHGLQQLAVADPQSRQWRLGCCAELIRADDERGDQWGAALLSLAVGLAKKRFGIVPEPAELADAADRFGLLDAPLLKLWCELLAMPAQVSSARRLENTSRMLRARGAEAMALAAAGEVHKAADLAVACGIPMPSRRGSAAASASVVSIRCFGEYRIEVDGCRVDLGRLRPQARNVLQLLSLSPGVGYHREVLEDALWPGVDHAVACHRLQVAVSSVRCLFDDDAVVVRRRGESYRLCLPEKSTVDVLEFTTALTAAAGASARADIDGRMAARKRMLGLYGGDLLPELATEFIETERQRLRRCAATAAAGLAADYRMHGDGAEALEAAQRSVDLDPYQDGPWCILAELYEQGGDLSAAEYTRREHARVQAELALPV